MLLENYVTGQGKNCILGNVANTVAYYKLGIDEEDLFFWFSPFDGDRQLEDMFKAMYKEAVGMSWHEYVDMQISLNTPVIVSIDPMTLPYIDKQVGDSKASHYINIVGITQDAIYVSDSYVPRYIPTVYEGWIKREEINDECVKKCFSIRREIIDYFSGDSRSELIKKHTVNMALERVSDFLNKKKADSGLTAIEELAELANNVKTEIENENYEYIYILLAGIRLNVINPLRYLNSLYTRIERNNESISEIINTKWEKINTKLIKFALAHKKTDSQQLAQMISEAVDMELIELKKFVSQVKKGEAHASVQLFETIS